MRDWRVGPGAPGVRYGVERQQLELDRAGIGRIALIGAEIVAAVALATGGVAALQSSTPVEGLGILYLLAVLAVAIRRGQLPALITAVLSVLTLNYLYIPPRHQLSIAHSSDVVELIVLLIAAVVVGRLAAVARERAAEADSRARLAAAREREAKLLAEVASAILAGESVGAQLESIGKRIAQATGAGRARVALEPVPAPQADEIAVPLHARAGNAWLYLTRDAGWESEAIERVADPVGRLIDVAVERERVSDRAADSEAARRAEVAKTAILHAISHDLRSPLTAITTAGSALAIGVSEAERSELIEVIETESARLARLVDDLLDLSRIEAGAVAPQADWCDLHDVVASAAAHAGREHPIEFRLPAELPLVRADAAQLERVFSEPDRERDQVLTRGRSDPDHAAGPAPAASRCGWPIGGAGSRAATAPRCSSRSSGVAAQARGLAPGLGRARAGRAWGWPSAAGSSRPTAGGSSCRPGGTPGRSSR